MPRCSRVIKLGRCGSYRSGEVSRPLGLSSASNRASSDSTGIGQNPRVSGAESLMTAWPGFITDHSVGVFLFGRQRAGDVGQTELLADPFVRGFASALLAEPLDKRR